MQKYDILAKKQTAGVSTKKDYPWVSQEGDLNVSIILNANYLLQNGNLSTKLLSFPAGLAMLDEILNVKEILSRLPEDLVFALVYTIGLMQHHCCNYKWFPCKGKL